MPVLKRIRFKVPNPLKMFRIRTKTLGGFAMVLALLLVVGGFATYGLMMGGTTFTEYRRLAQQSNASADVSAAMMRTRIAVETYIGATNAANAETVRKAVAETERAGEKALAAMTTPDQIQTLEDIVARVASYGEAFDKMVEQQARRNEIVEGTLAELGPAIAETFREVMKNALAEGNIEATYRAGTMQEAYLTARLNSQEFLLDNNMADYNAAVESLETVRGDTQVLLREIKDPSSRRLLRGVIGDVRDFAETLGGIHEAITARDTILREELKVLGPEVMLLTSWMVTDNQKTQDEMGAEASAFMERANMIVGGSVLVALLLGGALAWLIGSGIAKPVGKMTAAMRRLADGDHAVEIPARDYRDEIGEMAATVDVFKQNAIEREASMAREADMREKEKEAVRAREERARRLEEIIAGFDTESREVVAALTESAAELKRTATDVSTVAEQTDRQSTAVAAASQEASTNVQTVATASEQLRASIQEISRQVSGAAEIAGQANETAGDAEEKIRHLEQAAAQIGEVTQLINDIAEQTNLLALNATIEAARAGESGKGFAVVAQEVKSLAEQTGKATEDIRRQIDSMQRETRQSAEAVHSIGTVVRQVSEYTTSISSAIEEQTAATDEIAHNVSQASAASADVASNIEGVAEASKQTGAASESLRQVSDSLDERARDMKRSVESFLDGVKAL
ncbi:HAMP domain-containing protein [Marivibrio halodurans]|uniref:HAMP domain-containing protein n=1 Tax=Marivibrio halodurans TaxID=2039722 RepID=A0A8J7V3W4_9PROT|nr:methyl-accepting chemotaxis protein [Marivibrio halodurans]MBP5858731.1 HAMP domain-containing protein [Marivibrio halodurans]